LLSVNLVIAKVSILGVQTAITKKRNDNFYVHPGQICRQNFLWRYKNITFCGCNL